MEENNENMTFENSSLAENTAVTAAAVENTENLNAAVENAPDTNAAMENSSAGSPAETDEKQKKPYRKIPKRLLWRCWFIFCFFQRTCQCFDRAYCNAFTYGIMPILRYLYKGREDEDEQIHAGLMRTRNYYLCEQSFSTVVFAIIIGMEEQKANGADISDELIMATKTSIMGPLSGLGDAIHGSTFRQIAIALTIPYCLEGSIVGALLMLIGMNITPWLTTLIGFPQGYKLGSEFVLKLLQSGKMQKAANAAGLMSMFIMGGMAAKYANITLSLTFKNDYKEIKIQDMLDNAIPGLLTIGAVFGFYGLIQKKVSTNKLILGTMAIGIALSACHAMGY